MSVTGPKGFLAAGIAAGVKESGAPDLALVASATGALSVAAMFTTNRAAAAPVLVSKANLSASQNRAQAVILNSGCANAATGAEGLRAARAMGAAAARQLSVLDAEVLVCSTGLIGLPLPIERIEKAIPSLVEQLGDTSEHGAAAARAIMTTDTHPKQVLIHGDGFSVGGMAKGAGMIAPNLATMLVVLTTDAAVPAHELTSGFRLAVQDSFNELTVDGCTSTNDTALVLCSGLGAIVRAEELAEALAAACIDLAEQLALDAEGTTKLCRVHVTGARSNEDARRAARRVAQSLLVKTSLYGADPYWGRVVSELGSSGADFLLEQTRITYGATVVFDRGEEVPHDREAVVEYLSGKTVDITCDLGLGEHRATVRSTDLGHGYIDENMRTS